MDTKVINFNEDPGFVDFPYLHCKSIFDKINGLDKSLDTIKIKPVAAGNNPFMKN